MSNTGDLARRQGYSSPSPPVLPTWEAGPPLRPVIHAPPINTLTAAPVAPPPPVPRPHRKRPITLLDFWPSMRPGKMGRPLPTTPHGEPPAALGSRRRPHDPVAAGRHSKLQRPSPPPLLALDPPHDLPGPVPSPPTSPADVLFVGPAVPQVLQAISPSGDVRLSLRRYSVGDSLDSPHILLRLDLRIHPRDLYSIPSDGHCGYHTLAVLTHPLYPIPPAHPDRATLHRQLLLRLQALADPEIRAAATAGLLHPPPRLLPRAHWFDATWLHLIPDLPPIGCLALHDETDRSLSPWYYCTTLSGAPSQLEHSLKDLLRVADSGRLMLHTHSHFYPVTPPPFLSLAIRQCSALLQQQLGGTPLPVDFPRSTAQAAPPQVHRYTSIRALPGGI